MMTPNLQMEQFSLAHIRAIVADAGYQVIRPEPDIDSVDGVLMASFGRRPRIDFQAKATTQDVLKGNIIYLPLPVKNYNELRADTRTPRILIVTLMPKQRRQWLNQTNEELCLRHCAYWLCLEGRESTQNTSSVTVEIPTANMFNSAQLEAMMQKADRGESLC